MINTTTINHKRNTPSSANHSSSHPPEVAPTHPLACQAMMFPKLPSTPHFLSNPAWLHSQWASYHDMHLPVLLQVWAFVARRNISFEKLQIAVELRSNRDRREIIFLDGGGFGDGLIALVWRSVDEMRLGVPRLFAFLLPALLYFHKHLRVAAQ